MILRSNPFQLIADKRCPEMARDLALCFDVAHEASDVAVAMRLRNSLALRGRLFDPGWAASVSGFLDGCHFAEFRAAIGCLESQDMPEDFGGREPFEYLRHLARTYLGTE